MRNARRVKSDPGPMSDKTYSQVKRIGRSHVALGPWKLESNRVSPIGLRM